MAFEPNRTNPSICVPRVFPNITWKRVKEVFEELGLGEVERVDMVNKTNDKGEKFKRVFVHFKRWNKNKTAQSVKEKLLSGDSVKVVYDDPWFWKVFVSNAPKPVWEKRERKPHTGAKKQQRKPRLADDDEEKHPGAPTPAMKSSELSMLKVMMATQRDEIEYLRQQLAEMKNEPSGRTMSNMFSDGLASPPSSPVYTADDATSPPYAPQSPVSSPPPIPSSPPPLVRQTAATLDDEAEAAIAAPPGSSPTPDTE